VSSENTRQAKLDCYVNSKTAAVLGLFMATALTVTPGCGYNDAAQNRHVHVDRDGDGYCDEDGQPMNGRSTGSGYSRYYGLPGDSGRTSTAPGNSTAGAISDGTSGAKGGIGSHSAGSGG